MKIKNYVFILGTLISSVAFSQTGDTLTASFVSSGTTRSYLIYVPKIYDSLNVAVPLVMNMHGFGGSSSQQMLNGDFRPIADTANFIVVHPQGLTQNVSVTEFGIPLQIPSPGWAVFGTVADGDADRKFIADLVDTIKAHYKINSNRVYATGFSQGGFICHDLAAFNSGAFAAIASVSGTMVPSHYSACAPMHPMPVMMIHGTSDPLIGYYGSVSTTGIFKNAVNSLSVDTILTSWISFNKCIPLSDPASEYRLPDVNTSDGSTVEHLVYKGGLKGSSVEHYKVFGGGHTWPSLTGATSSGTLGTFGSLGNTNQDFNASKEIWRFFSQYTLMSSDSEVGNFSPLVVTTIAEIAGDYGLTVYPNPSNGIFNIALRENTYSVIKIVNGLGETVLEKITTDNIITINLSNSPEGIYFYQITNKIGALESGKLIIKD